MNQMISKWGENDEIGALNEITPDSVLDSLKLVKKGKVFSLAQTYEMGMPTSSFHGPFSYSTFRRFPIYPETSGQKNLNESKLGSLVCRYELSDHTGTHVDSLNHTSVDYELYNGLDVRNIQTDHGTTRQGIETMPPVVVRGILIDLAAYLGVEVLDEEYEISSFTIREVLKNQNVQIRPGDGVLFYTGYCKLWGKQNEKYLGAAPGIGEEAARWLAAQRISITGTDTARYEVVSNRTRRLFPCHQVLIKENGIRLIENLKLDELAREENHEFLFVCTPLKLKGGAGSPVAPIAVL